MERRRPGPYRHIALASVIRHNFSNYDELIFQVEAKSLQCSSHPKDVMAAHQNQRECFDRQICKLSGQVQVRPGLERGPGEANWARLEQMAGETISSNSRDVGYSS